MFPWSWETRDDDVEFLAGKLTGVFDGISPESPETFVSFKEPLLAADNRSKALAFCAS